MFVCTNSSSDFSSHSENCSQALLLAVQHSHASCSSQKCSMRAFIWLTNKVNLCLFLPFSASAISQLPFFFHKQILENTLYWQPKRKRWRSSPVANTEGQEIWILFLALLQALWLTLAHQIEATPLLFPAQRVLPAAEGERLHHGCVQAEHVCTQTYRCAYIWTQIVCTRGEYSSNYPKFLSLTQCKELT